MTMTHTHSTSLLGRAPMPVPAGAVAIAANHARVRALPAAALAATPTHDASTTEAMTTPALAAATWLGGSGFGDDMGFGFVPVTCESTVPTNSTKRIHPGRLEGMT